jgi:hypothetical protein
MSAFDGQHGPMHALGNTVQLLYPVFLFNFNGNSSYHKYSEFFISFLLFSALFYAASKKLKLHFNLLEFLVYFFFYQPLAFFTLIVGIITPFLSSKYKLDWKV